MPANQSAIEKIFSWEAGKVEEIKGRTTAKPLRHVVRDKRPNQAFIVSLLRNLMPSYSISSPLEI
jgi:hypothetical protein